MKPYQFVEPYFTESLHH